jgi:hypothetical protein
MKALFELFYQEFGADNVEDINLKKKWENGQMPSLNFFYISMSKDLLANYKKLFSAVSNLSDKFLSTSTLEDRDKYFSLSSDYLLGLYQVLAEMGSLIQSSLFEGNVLSEIDSQDFTHYMSYIEQLNIAW